MSIKSRMDKHETIQVIKVVDVVQKVEKNWVALQLSVVCGNSLYKISNYKLEILILILLLLT